jgi:hypothetical protein
MCDMILKFIQLRCDCSRSAKSEALNDADCTRHLAARRRWLVQCDAALRVRTHRRKSKHRYEKCLFHLYSYYYFR